jgi:pimeloyl-ACP methyl ester carboxylesterase
MMCYAATACAVRRRVAQRMPTPQGKTTRSTMKIQVGAQEMHVRVEGEGAPVVLIHGFPDSGAIWDKQVQALVANGYQTIVPDLPGCGDSGIPEELSGYSIPNIETALVGVIDELGIDHFQLIGHDWGAAISWDLIPQLEGRVDRFATLQIGHFNEQMSGGEDQRMRYWYIWWFQHKGVVEECLQANDWLMFREWMAGENGVPGHPYPDRIIEGLSRPHRLTAALDIYRADNVDPRFFQGIPLGGPAIDCPTLAIYMSGDKYIGPSGLANSGKWVNDEYRLETVDGGGHFGQYEHAAEVNAYLLEFLDPSLR